MFFKEFPANCTAALLAWDAVVWSAVDMVPTQPCTTWPEVARFSFGIVPNDTIEETAGFVDRDDLWHLPRYEAAATPWVPGPADFILFVAVAVVVGILISHSHRQLE